MVFSRMAAAGWMGRGGLVLAMIGLVGLAPSGRGEKVERWGTRYEVFVARPDEVELYWRNPSGERFGTLARVQTFVEGRGRRVRMLMNAGIFEPDGTPTGLLTIGGNVLFPLNERAGRGNFFLSPNGVFFVGEKGAFVRTTAEYARRPGPVPRLAIQSGPILLRSGITHPAFRADSSSRLHRNGVGVRRDGAVIFAITEFEQPRWPNLWEFADFFRALGCEDALFLDGDLSQMVIDPAGPIRPGNHFGAIFAVMESGEAGRDGVSSAGKE